MANRFPLIANASDSKIYELPSGDNLDLTGSGIANSTAVITLPTVTSTLATLAGTETFTNKTLTSPIISSISNTGTLTLPTSTDTLVGRATTDTLTNKTINLASNTLTATSAQIAAAVSDETGSGVLVFATSPTLVTPTLGVATATSINKVAITAPATSATLTIANGKTLTASNTLTFTGTDASSVAFGAGGTVAYTGNKLSVFAATTSAELAGVISDETGTGSLVFSASPTFTGTANFANISASGDLTVTGNLTINGTTTNINTTNLVVEDKNIVLGDVTTPSNTTADGGGITLKGATDKTLNWVNATGAWTSSEDFNLLTGKVYEINGTPVLSATQVLGRTPAGSSAGDIVTIDATQTLTNKTLTSPTLTTPALGTPSSGTLTNCTGLPNAGLVNSSVTVGTTAIALGASATTIAGLSSVTSTSFVGALTGNASTATTLQTSRTISLGGDLSGSASFNGSADITITATIAANSVALGTDTTGAYVVDVVAGTGISLSETANNAEGNTVTVTNSGVTSIVAGTGVTISGATGAVTVNAGVPNASTQVSSLGVGTAASGTTGEIRATNAITSFYSDERLKENITEIDNAIEKVMSLRGVTYTANELAESFGYTNKDEQVGVIAQDVEKVLPQIVKPAPFDIISLQEGIEISRSGENYKTVQYEKLVPLLIQAIKEQQVMIEELQKKVGN